MVCLTRMDKWNLFLTSRLILFLNSNGNWTELSTIQGVIARVIKPRSRRLGGFLLCLRFIYLFFLTAQPQAGRFLALPSFYLFIFKPRSCRLGGFLLCLRFIIFFVSNYIQTSADDVIISQLQAISFRHIPPQESFVKLAN